MFLSNFYLLPSSEAESPKALASLVSCCEQWGFWQKQRTIFLQISQRFVHTTTEVMAAKLHRDEAPDRNPSPLQTVKTVTIWVLPNQKLPWLSSREGISMLPSYTVYYGGGGKKSMVIKEWSGWWESGVSCCVVDMVLLDKTVQWKKPGKNKPTISNNVLETSDSIIQL